MSRPRGGTWIASQPVGPPGHTSREGTLKTSPGTSRGVYVVIRSHLCPVVKIMAVISILSDKWHLQFLLG